MVVPEVRGPITPGTWESHSFCATAAPCLGSAASSSACNSNLIFLPPMLMPWVLSSSMSIRAPFSFFVALAVVGLGAGKRSHMADLDHLLLCQGHACSCRHGGGQHGQFQLQLH